jgi:hypothetical protein
MDKFLDYAGLEVFTEELKKYIASKIPDASDGSEGEVLGIKSDGTLGFITITSSETTLSNVSEAKF